MKYDINYSLDELTNLAKSLDINVLHLYQPFAQVKTIKGIEEGVHAVDLVVGARLERFFHLIGAYLQLHVLEHPRPGGIHG